MPVGTTRHRRVWQITSLLMATLLVICLAAWGVSVFRGDVVFVRVTADSGLGVVTIAHRVAFGWSTVDALAPYPTSRLRWQPVNNGSVVNSSWLDVEWNHDEYYLLLPWAVPVIVFATAFLIARGRAGRHAATAFDVIPLPPRQHGEAPAVRLPE